MVTVRVDFETIERGQVMFKCLTELHLDASYQHIIRSMIRKWLIDGQPESEEKQRLLSIIESKLDIKAERVLQCNVDVLAQILPNIEDLVNMEQ